ncbi:MAG: hypothetical protein QM803_08530 [Rhodocyclaceae bacterium]
MAVLRRPFVALAFIYQPWSRLRAFVGWDFVFVTSGSMRAVVAVGWEGGALSTAGGDESPFLPFGWLFGLGLDCLGALAGSSPRRASNFLVADKKVTKEAAPQHRRPLADPLRCAVEKAAAELALRAQTVLADGYAATFSPCAARRR